MPRPICAYCGKRHGRKVYHRFDLLIEMSEEVPAYRGNQELVSEEIWPELGADPAYQFVAMDSEKSEHSLLGNFFDVHPGSRHSVGPGLTHPYKGRRGRRIIRETWDGESFRGQYGDFCSLRCAAKFGQASFDAGYRIVSAVGDGAEPADMESP